MTKHDLNCTLAPDLKKKIKEIHPIQTQRAQKRQQPTGRLTPALPAPGTPRRPAERCPQRLRAAASPGPGGRR